MFYICSHFCENISKGFRVIERTQFVMDRQPWAKQYVSLRWGETYLHCVGFNVNGPYIYIHVNQNLDEKFYLSAITEAVKHLHAVFLLIAEQY